MRRVSCGTIHLSLSQSLHSPFRLRAKPPGDPRAQASELSHLPVHSAHRAQTQRSASEREGPSPKYGRGRIRCFDGGGENHVQSRGSAGPPGEEEEVRVRGWPERRHFPQEQLPLGPRPIPETRSPSEEGRGQPWPWETPEASLHTHTHTPGTSRVLLAAAFLGLHSPSSFWGDIWDSGKGYVM